VFREPLRQPASTTTVASPSAAISLLRCKNLHLVGAAPGATSDITVPFAAISSSRRV
jgi:hypothetical protein